MDNQNKIKLLFLIHDLGGGGAERVLVNLVNNMDLERFDVTVMSLFGGGVNEKFLDKRIRYKTTFPIAIPGNSHFMKLLSPAMLHKLLIHDYYDIEVAYLEGPCTRIISGCQEEATKCVAWLHSDFSMELNYPYASFKTPEEAQGCYRRFNKVIGVSKQTVDDFQKYYPDVVSREVLYNTNETEHIQTLSREPVEGGVFSKQTINFITAGKLTPVKGFDRLLAAFGKIIIENGSATPMRMYFLGCGEEENKLRRMAKELGIAEQVVFMGFQENPYKFIRQADVYICSSIREGFSTAVTEALVLGKPVVATDISGMRELLGEDNEYGLVVENSIDGIQRGMLQILDCELRCHYANKAVERSKMFSTRKTVAAVEDMFEQLIGKKKGLPKK